MAGSSQQVRGRLAVRMWFLSGEERERCDQHSPVLNSIGCVVIPPTTANIVAPHFLVTHRTNRKNSLYEIPVSNLS